MPTLHTRIAVLITAVALSSFAAAWATHSCGPHNPQSTELPLAQKTAYDWARRGDFWTGCRDYRHAVQDYSEAIRLDPSLVTAISCRGDNYFDLGDYKSALLDYNEVLKRTPEDTFDLHSRANTKLKLSDKAGAIDDLSRVIAIKSKSPSQHLFYDFRKRAEIYLELEKFREAVSDCDIAIRLSPKDTWSYIIRGRALAFSGHYDLAMNDFNRAIKISPTSSSSYNVRATWLADRNKAAALEDYNMALKLDNQFGMAYGNRGLLHLEMGDMKSALADFDQALNIDPSDRWAARHRADVRFLMGDIVGALSDLQMASLFCSMFGILSLIGLLAMFPLLQAFSTTYSADE